MVGSWQNEYLLFQSDLELHANSVYFLGLEKLGCALLACSRSWSILQANICLFPSADSPDNGTAEQAPLLGRHQLQVDEGHWCEESELNIVGVVSLGCCCPFWEQRVLFGGFNAFKLVEICLCWSSVLYSLQSLVKVMSVLGPKRNGLFGCVYFWFWSVQLSEWKSQGLHWKCLFQSCVY